MVSLKHIGILLVIIWRHSERVREKRWGGGTFGGIRCSLGSGRLRFPALLLFGGGRGSCSCACHMRGQGGSSASDGAVSTTSEGDIRSTDHGMAFALAVSMMEGRAYKVEVADVLVVVVCHPLLARQHGNRGPAFGCAVRNGRCSRMPWYEAAVFLS